MVSPTDPNKQKMLDSTAIEKMQPTYGLTKGQYARVYHGQYVNGYRLSVVGKKVTSVAVPTVPAAPTNVVATAGNASASVAFKAPVQVVGQLPITAYTVTSSPGGLTGTGASSPIAVAGLTNGTAYTFTVKATNSVGQSAASAASTAVTPAA